MTSVSVNVPAIKLQTDFRGESILNPSGSFAWVPLQSEYQVFSVTSSGRIVSTTTSAQTDMQFPGVATVVSCIQNGSTTVVLGTDGQKLYVNSNGSWNPLSISFSTEGEVIKELQPVKSPQGSDVNLAVVTQVKNASKTTTFYTIESVLTNPVCAPCSNLNAITGYNPSYDFQYGVTLQIQGSPFYGFLISGKMPISGNQFEDATFFVPEKGPFIMPIVKGTYQSFAGWVDPSSQNLFAVAVGADKVLYYFQQNVAKLSLTNVSQFTPTPISSSLNCSFVRLVSDTKNGNSVLRAFLVAVDPNSAVPNPSLFQTTTALSSIGWETPSPLVAKITQFQIQKDSSNIVKVLTTASVSQALNLTYEDPKTGDWHNDAAIIPSSSNVDTIKSYFVTGTVTDPTTGKNIPNASYQLTSDIDIEVASGGQIIMLEAGYPFQGQLSILGTFDIIIRTASLASPVLSLWVQGMSSTDTLAIYPGGDIQASFQNVTSDDLLNAKSQVDGSYLLGDEYRNPTVTTNMAQALNHVTSLAIPMGFQKKSRKYFTSKSSHNTCGEYTRKSTANTIVNPNKININAVRKQSWKIDFTGQYPVFTLMTAEQAELHFQTVRQNLAERKEKARYYVPLGLFDWDWGDLWEAVEDGFAAIADVVVTVADKISAAVHAVVDGVTQFFDFVVDTVQQAFDLVESIFDQVKVFFEDLWNWLCFLFGWDDIKNTRKVIEWGLNSFTKYISDIINVDAPAITNQAFQWTRTNISNGFDSMISSLQGVTVRLPNSSEFRNAGFPSANYGLGSGMPDLPSSASWFLEKLLSVWSDSMLNFPGAPGNVSQLWDALVNNAGVQYATQDIQTAIQSVCNFLQNWNDQNDMWSAALSTILTVLKSLVLAILDVIFALVTAAIQLIGAGVDTLSTFLNEPMDIPVISWIMDQIFGVKVSVLGLFSTILAIPATIAYKIATGSAPFTDDQVSQITGSPFTGPPLPNSSHNEHNLQVEDPPAALSKTFGFLAGVAQCLYTFWDASADIEAQAGTLTSKLLRGGILLFPLVITLCKTPWMKGSWDNIKTSQKVQIAAWCSGFVPPLLVLIGECIGKGPRGSTAGRILLGFAGALEESLNIATGILKSQDGSNPTAAWWVNAVVSPLSTLLKWLYDIIPNPAVGKVVVVVIDVVSDISGGVAQCVAALQSSLEQDITKPSALTDLPDGWYFRTGLGDTRGANARYASSACACPDIIPWGSTPVDPKLLDKTFGGDAYNTVQGGNIYVNQTNYFYLRGISNVALQNQGIQLFYAPSNILLWPSLWQLNALNNNEGSSTVLIPSVTANQVTVAPQPFVWVNPPAPQDHYCMISRTANAPAPPNQFGTMDDWANFIYNNPTYGWRNCTTVATDTPDTAVSTTIQVDSTITQPYIGWVQMSYTNFPVNSGSGWDLAWNVETPDSSGNILSYSRSTVTNASGSVTSAQATFNPNWSSKVDYYLWTKGIPAPSTGHTTLAFNTLLIVPATSNLAKHGVPIHKALADLSPEYIKGTYGVSPKLPIEQLSMFCIIIGGDSIQVVGQQPETLDKVQQQQIHA